MKNPLLDQEFLYQLNQYRHKEIYARIISLNNDEHPLEQIEGRVTGGSINIDGNSAVRRTCNLSLVAKDVNITDFYWGVSNKFTLEIGVKNFINSEYPDIIWFKQGIYVITSFNSALSQNSYSISISGKDKMCLLNGDIGGNLPSSIDFGKIDTYSNTYTKTTIEDYTQYKANVYYIYVDGDYVLAKNEYLYDNNNQYNEHLVYYTKDVLLDQKDLKLKDIIREAIHEYGKEPYQNIRINDLDNYGLELLEYRGDSPLYMLYNEEASIYDQMITEENAKKTEVITQENGSKKINECIFNTGVDKLNDARDKFLFQKLDTDGNLVDVLYSVTEVEFGQAIGYRTTDLVYTGELISSIGESLTSILDKIKTMLGAFEYFYDLDGNFVFQAKKIYANNSWNPLVKADDNIFARDSVEESPYSYSFEDVNLIQKFQNTPAINNLKNDYSVWGVRKGISGADIPIHARYAIHTKPEYYKGYDNKIYFTDINIFNILKEKAKEKIKEEVIAEVKSFEPKYPLPVQLNAPIRQPNGDWSPGWWNIKDWHDYYVLLTGEEPRYTMKWYSQNSVEGCLRLFDVFPDYRYTSSSYRNRYVWLVIMPPDGDGSNVNIQHGSGSPYDPGSERTLYESYINEEGKIITQKVEPITKKYFIPPYSGCTDSHTYLEFLKNDAINGNEVYFYNPAFPDFTFDEALEDKIEEEYEEYLAKGELNLVDWREVIYQMAKDYYKHGQEPDFFYNISHNNIQPDGINSYYPTGQTGYEIFYSDIQGFWRQLYDPNPELTYDTEGGFYEEKKYYKAKTLTEEEFGENQDKYYIYSIDLKKYIPAVTWNAETQYYTMDEKLALDNTYSIQATWNPFEEKTTFTCDYYLKGKDDNENYSEEYYYWNKNVIHAPDLLNFWLDFYETTDQLSQYTITAIGDRPKVVNNDKVTSIYFRNVPQVIIFTPDEFDALEIRSGYTYLNVDGWEDLFTISVQGKSAEEEINELFNTHSFCTEGISITTIPIYYLEPNTLIYIHNEENQINGKYQVNKITIPLAYNGTMSISATKINEKI